MVLDTSAVLDVILDTETGRTLHGFFLDPEPALLHAEVSGWEPAGWFEQ